MSITRPYIAGCVDETYIKVCGKWTYLYRTVDKLGNTIDFYLSTIRNAKAAKRFLCKAIRAFDLTRDPVGDKRMIERGFGLVPSIMNEAIAMIGEHLKAAA